LLAADSGAGSEIRRNDKPYASIVFRNAARPTLLKLFGGARHLSSKQAPKHERTRRLA
jgi:hypothetical protein